MSVKILELRERAHQFGQGLEPESQPNPMTNAAIQAHANAPIMIKIPALNAPPPPLPELCKTCPNRDKGWCGKCAIGYSWRGRRQP
jgi:hypothetical protein